MESSQLFGFPAILFGYGGACFLREQWAIQIARVGAISRIAESQAGKVQHMILNNRQLTASSFKAFSRV
jgi:hypothetical protein